MHELTLAHSVAEIAAGSLDQRGELDRVRCVRLRVGDLSGVDPEALAFCFEVVREEWAELREAVLEVHRAEVTFRCLDCGAERKPGADELFVETRSACDGCGGGRMEMSGGRELEVTGVEWITEAASPAEN